MSRIFILFFLFCTSIASFADDVTIDVEQVQKTYWTSTPEVKARIDTLMRSVDENYKRNQVVSVCGVRFGIDMETAKHILKSKYGEVAFDAGPNTLVYENVNYANTDYDQIQFRFQSDGANTYLSACVLCKYANSLSKARKLEKDFAEILSQKYTSLTEVKDINGETTHIGGISPLWDGHWYNFSKEHVGAVCTGIVKFGQRVRKGLGLKYATKIAYGPYKFVKEEY